MADITLSESRQGLLLEAVYELMKLTSVLPNLVPVDDSQSHYAVKGVCARMAALSSALLSGLDDSMYSDKSLDAVINSYERLDSNNIPA